MPKRIIIADDRESCRKDLSEWIKSTSDEIGVRVEITGVTDGEPFVQKVLEGEVNYDLGFIDNMMVKMNGPDAIKLIRSKGKTIPLYIFCAGDKSVKKSALDSGATGYIDRSDPNCWAKVDEVLYEHLR